jgi:Arc/MetJ-type ribon-helix-helix transcriptional regulator
MMTKRIQLDLSDSSVARLDALKEQTEATSYAEVVRNALRLYEWAIEAGGERARMVVQRDDGTTEIVRLFL